MRRATRGGGFLSFILSYFYPRSPCGERLNEDRYGQQYWRFLSTLSLRRATRHSPKRPQNKLISIHALLAESDRSLELAPYSWHYFYPRSPCGERPLWLLTSTLTSRFLSTLSLRRATFRHKKSPCKALISIHALLAESDKYFLEVHYYVSYISIHALLAESDTAQSKAPTKQANFYPRSPCGERQIASLQFEII